MKRIFNKLLFIVLICIMVSQNKTYVESKEVIYVGTNAEYPPFEYLDENGDLTGFDIDLMNSIAEEVNLEIEWVDLPFDSLMASMEAGSIQVIAAAIGPTKDREKSVNFSDVYYKGSQSIIYNVENVFKSFKELEGKDIAVLEGSMGDLIASGENTDYGIIENAKVKRFKNISTAVFELKNGATDVVVVDTIMAERLSKENDDISFEIVEGTEEDTVFCVSKKNEELLKKINLGLNNLKDSGEYDRIYDKYFNDEEVESFNDGGFFDLLHFIFIEENRWKYYVEGIGVTISVAILSIVLGMIIGLFVAIVKLNADKKAKKTIMSRVVSVYVDIIRGTPSVLQLMIVYFAVFHSKYGYVAAFVSFGLNSGAYISEIIRGGILAVDVGQVEAGRSLGLSYYQTMRHIVLPQAIKNITPAMGNEYIQLIKETSILGYIGILDLTKAASYVSSRTYQMFIPLIVAGIIYYTLVKLLSVALSRYERKLRLYD